MDCGVFLWRACVTQTLLFPTEAGLVFTSPQKSFGNEVCSTCVHVDRVGTRCTRTPFPLVARPAQLMAAYDYGAYKLSDYKLNVPGASGSFFYIAKVSESMTPRLIQSFYRSNFTLSRPWLTRILTHLTLLPAGGLAEDEAQVGCC